ncbi:MAG TPA: hypothetical protein VJN64_14270 [Terriglobales bacterium]|nr:hypothetical protein [Terriglobales bacterium]
MSVQYGNLRRWSFGYPARHWLLRAAVVLAAMTIAYPVLAQPPAPATIDLKLAQEYFAEMESLSNADAGRLWGVRLYGPMMFVDPSTHQAVANQADKEGRLHAQNGVFGGQLPPEMPIANTEMDWSGVRWTMVMWPLAQNRRPRKQLMAHESFHRLQPELGLTPLDNNNNHLDGRIGRTWLQLEWRALTKALATTGEARRQAISDALYFRALRRALIPNAATNENRLETNEGIAEYTGVKLSARYAEEARLVAEVTLWNGPNRSPFVRSFAYVSGPAYGVLLDESRMAWRKKLKPDSDLGELLRAAYRITISAPTEAEAVTRSRKYDGDEVIAHEKVHETQRQKIIAEQRSRLIEGPVLVLPLGPNVNYGFDPDEVTAIDEQSSVFGGDVQVTDDWGVLKSTGGVLIVRENGKLVRVQVPAPENPTVTSITGSGWALDLKPGWKLVSGPRAHDWTVQKQ